MDEISAEDEIREAFKVFDSVNKTHFYHLLTSWPFFNMPFFQNGDGFINRQELGYVMDNLGLQMDKDEIEVDFEIVFGS